MGPGRGDSGGILGSKGILGGKGSVGGKGVLGLKGIATPSGAEIGGNQALGQLPGNVQSWIQMQANILVQKGQFGPAEQLRLTHLAAALFPGTDAALVVALVRFKALQSSTGGSLNRLYGNQGGLTAFQQQLLPGVGL